ncbi:DUF4145 domain-containing protein [Pseudomonas sp. B392_1p]|uniref:DUF4145 domain-containing protein n=1 Tax=Pseudomonas sp. B392_1p TaxID=3457507 RepID=UPI003FD61ED0
MDESLFITTYAENQIPSLECPCCRNAPLSINELVVQATAASDMARSEDWWELEYEELVFRLTLKCPHCRETVFAQGDGYVEEEIEVDNYGDWTRHWVKYLRPKYFFPSLKFVSCPAATPEEVQKHLDAASALYFSNPAACCNSLRMAAEEILTSLGVLTGQPGNFISFGNRIHKLPESSSEYNLLDAIRWLGNAGSHSGSAITHKDAENAFNVIDLLVDECYSDRKKKIHELAAAIRASKGPIALRIS